MWLYMTVWHANQLPSRSFHVSIHRSDFPDQFDGFHKIPNDLVKSNHDWGTGGLWHWACLRPPWQFCDATLPAEPMALGSVYYILNTFCLFRTNALRLTYQTISFKHVLVHWSLFRLKWILSDMPWSSKVPMETSSKYHDTKAMVQQKSYILVN